jgi:hypothetical protein
VEFTYTINQVKDCINDTEQQLRDLITTTLSRKYGPDWEYSSPVWNDEIREELEERRRQDQGGRPYQIVSQRLLDYTDLIDLQNIIERHWDLFANVFRSKDRIMHRLDDLRPLRNPEMHGRPDILPHQKHLCLGLCGDILLAIEHWHHGYEHLIKDYAVQLKFPIYMGTKDENVVQEEAKTLAQQWLDKVCGKLGGKLRVLSEDQDTKTYQIAFQQMHIRVNMSWNYRGYDGRQFFRAADIGIRTSQASALHKAIEAGKQPYLWLNWTLRDDLDTSIVVAQVLERTGKKPISSSSIRAGNISTLTGAEFRIDGSNEESIRVSLSRWQPDADATLSLSYDGPSGTGFYHAHEVFSVKNVLPALYGDIPFSKLRQMITEACSTADRV